MATAPMPSGLTPAAKVAVVPVVPQRAEAISTQAKPTKETEFWEVIAGP